MNKELTPDADLVLRIMAVSEAWGFDAIDTPTIAKAFEILKPLLSAPPNKEGAENG